jgi:hypothetical protein
MFCRQQVAEFRPHVQTFRELGVEPYVIGSGSASQARRFQQKMEAFALPILSDEPRASYRAAGWKRSAAATMLSPKSWLRGLKIAGKYWQGRTEGDPWQLGGALVIRPDGSTVYRFASNESGDHPSLAALTDAARRAAT